MSLRSKALLAVLPLVAGAGFLLVALSNRTVRSTLLNEAARSGIAMMEEESRSLEKGAAAGSEKLLLPRLQSLMRRSDALSAFVADANSVVLAHSNVAEAGRKASSPFAQAAAVSAAPSSRFDSSGDGPALDLAVPIWSHGSVEAAGEEMLFSSAGTSRKRLGTLFLRLPVGKYLQLHRMIFGRLLWIIIGVVCVALAVFFLLLELVLRPVRLLTAATERVRAGDYGVTVQSGSGDEIGRLADSFNRMSSGLKETTVSRDHLENMMRSIPDAILVTDKDAVISMVNPAGVRLLGLDAAELRGRKACDVFTKACREQNGWIGRALKGEPVDGREAAIDSRGKGEVPVLLSVSRLEGGGLVAVIRDITERKKMEEALLQGEKMSAVGVLAAGVAHEINNPLGIILGFAQAMAKRIKEDDVFALPVKSIERESLRCKNLVQSLLVFSRASKSEQWEELDPNAAIDGALALVLAQTKTRGVELRVEPGRGLPKIFANKNQIQQVIINLANNAIDAMPDGGTLTIATERAADGGALFLVRDTGCGIPKDIRGRIFEPFFSTKEVGKGTGLGLALVYEIVQKHHGSIELGSEEGKGTTFTVSLPAGEAKK